ncbi:14168_t:CDS:2 [Funneliformis mosseae]|uniref:14168_t:CDS:1 n=1 Tax=Funneliformis mosseae TaxID=27381 RepID=A0A9N8V3F3_FUNMO|nr:14168_t:CDS:2 [Funneliformis mosseae]
MSSLSVPPPSEGRQPTFLDTLKGFTKDNLSHGVRSNLSKLDPRLPEDLKNITLYLKEEKNVLTSLQNAATERREDSGDDIADITEKLADLLTKISDVEIVMTEKYEHYRNIIKEIRTAEARLIVHKEKKRKINDEINRIMKSHPKSPRIAELEADLKMVNHDALADENDVANIRRRKFKEAIAVHLNATFEAAEKTAIISGFGWDLVEQIDATPTRPGEQKLPYKGLEITQQTIKDCQLALHRWQPSSSEIRPILPTLTNTAPAQLAAQKAEYEAKISQLMTNMNALKDEHEVQVTGFATSLENQKRDYEAQINELTSALAAQKEGYEAQLNDLSTALQTEKATAERKSADAASALESHKQEFNTKFHEISAELEASKKKYEEQLKQYNALISQKQEYEIALRERDSIISKLQVDVNGVATEKGKLSQVIKELEETLKSKSTTIDQKEDKIGKLEDDISSIKDQLAGLKISPAITTNLSDPSSSTRSVVGHVPVLSEGSTISEEPPNTTSSNNSTELNGPGPTAPHVPPQFGGFGPPSQQGYYGQQYYQQSFYNPQQPFYGQAQQGQSPYGGFQQPPPPGQFGQAAPSPQPPSGFVGGFFLGQPDDAPPAYDGPPKEGLPEDKKEKN